ncbi:hypothetical protein CQ10_40650 [Bradyrhizobium valentinum]|nr:hypothetical protein CQ10_40650 [Bradyrhizobium valentinum]
MSPASRPTATPTRSAFNGSGSFRLARNSKSPIAEAAGQQMAQLYAIEAAVLGLSPDIPLAPHARSIRYPSSLR